MPPSSSSLFRLLLRCCLRLALVASAAFTFALGVACGDDETRPFDMRIHPLEAGGFGAWDNAVFVIRVRFSERIGGGAGAEEVALGAPPALEVEFRSADDGRLEMPALVPGDRFVTVEGLTFRGTSLQPFSRGRVRVRLGGAGAAIPTVYVSPINGFGRLPTTMTVPRSGHTATLLPDGRVLVAGGIGPRGQPSSSAEIFDPALGTFAPLAAGLECARAGHRATVLPLSGDIVFTGGTDSGCLERFVPAGPGAEPAGFFSRMVPTLSIARRDHGAVAVDGGRALWVLGGEDGTGQPLASVELIDLEADQVRPGPALDEARAAPVVATLEGGTELAIIGGRGATRAAARVDIGAEEIVPLSWSAEEMPPLEGHVGIPLLRSSAGDQSDLLVAFGLEPGPAASERFYRIRPENLTAAPQTEPVTLAERDGSPFGGRVGAEVVELLDGTVLLVGGRDAAGELPASKGFLYRPAEMDPALRTTDTRFWLHEGRVGHRMTRLQSGLVLVTGGTTLDGEPSSSVELFVPREDEP